MPDVVGYRTKFGVIVPSTNTVVEAEYNMMRLPGVTFHVGRMYIAEPVIDSNETFQRLIQQITASLDTAIRDALTCEPDYLVMGMSAGTFWGGLEGAREFEGRVRAQTRLGVSTGSLALKAALELFGTRTIAVISPYQAIADFEVSRFFTEAGFTVARFKGLRCPTATSIARVDERTLLAVLRALDGPDVDAIVQVGTNLAMVRLADEAERWLGKPVIAINAATLWHALRTNGIGDQLIGFGTLLREH
jgi:maleate isomerase